MAERKNEKFTEAYTGKKVVGDLLPIRIGHSGNGWRCVGVAYVRDVAHYLLMRD